MPRNSVLLLLFLLGGCTLGEPPAKLREAPASPGFYASLASPSARVDAEAARDLINGYRRNLGLAPVVIDPDLSRFAEGQAAAMARTGAADATRAAPLMNRLGAAGIKTGAARENASAGYHTVSDAFSGWRGSPGHDATFRFRQARRMGIATGYNSTSKYKVYWTLVMAE